jgi:succinate dehydrogenase / fumarate reductase cytochrome b subunit
MSDTAKNTAPKKTDRPLSPHLQVYRLPMTALMSITHRMTGVALSAGCILITAFLIAAAVSEEAFVWIKDFSITPLGTIILFAWSFALYYHTCNGVRHLIWDTVHLLEERKAVAAGWVVLLSSAGLTAATWYFAAIY